MSEIVLEIAMALQLAGAIAATAVVLLWWRSRGRIWTLEQRVAKLEGVLEFFAKGD